MEEETFSPIIWECACGEGHLSKEFERNGYIVFSSDSVDRGYGEQLDFLKTTKNPFTDEKFDIVTNPPYRYAKEFVEHSLDILPYRCKCAMFLKVLFLEGKSRKILFEKYPPKKIYISSSRLMCAKNGNFDRYKSSATAYAWYVWIKGYSGETTIEWIN